MKVLKINNRDYVIKFTSKVVRDLNSKNITLNKLIEDMQIMKLDNLYEAFYYAIKDMNDLKTIDEALNLIDAYFEENEENDMEKFFNVVIEEYAKAMGLGKRYKELIIKNQ